MPKTEKAQKIAQDFLAQADIQINGSRPWDIQVHNEDFYSRVLKGGSLAFGESYMDGWWDCAQIDEMIARIYKAELSSKVSVSFSSAWIYISALLSNKAKTKAFEIGEKHYDIGNDLFSKMLDSRMMYSCAYWKNSEGIQLDLQSQMTLDQAQEAKLDLICRKIGLKKGQRVLDIGCGWGGFARYAAEKYGAQVVGVTVSKQQAEVARKVCEGWPVEIRIQDYRKVDEQFDQIISIGMFEHVTYKNYPTYMKVVARCLKDDGLFILHTIGSKLSFKDSDPWIDKYIFPNSMLPSVAQISKASEPYFVMEDWHNFGAHYDKTLMTWHSNFNATWRELQPKYSDRFQRMWNFYLLTFAGLFRARHFQLWQIVFSKRGVRGGYESVR